MYKRQVPRGFGSYGDMVLILNDGSKVEMNSFPFFREKQKFIEENINTDGNPFQEGNISLADLVQMEKMNDNKVFIEEIERNISPKKVDAAVSANKLPKDTNRLSGPTLY